MSDLASSTRYAVRALVRSPSFTITVVLTLGLGIAAATLMFSIVNGVLLRPLPYPNQDRLVEIVHAAPELGLDALFASPAIYFSYRDHNESFESLGLWDWDSSPVTVVGPGPPESVQSVEVTHEVLGILGADPMLGRTFTSTDDSPESAPTVVLSNGFWQRHYGAASPLGQTLLVDGVVREVVGVLPEWFTFFDYPAEIFYPFQPRRATAAFPSFDGRAIARLKDGVTLAQADADVGRMIPLVGAEFSPPPGLTFENFELVPRLRLLKDSVVGELGGTLWTLMGTVAALLLIACANVVNLFLVRAEARRRDLAIRAALGAALGDVVKIVLPEAVVLALIGGALGVGIANAALPVLLATSAVDIPQVARVGIDPAALLFAAVASVLVTALLTLIPLLHTRYSEHARAPNLGGRSIGAEREGARMRHLLLVTQVALALVLLVGSGLMIRTFLALRDVDPGFLDADGVQTFQVVLSNADAETIEQAVRIQHSIAERLAAVAGVERAAFAAFNDALPLDGDGRTAPVYVEGSPAGDVAPSREIGLISPGFFEALRTPLVVGRSFSWDDVYDQRPVALVSENLARSEWGSAAAALGRRVSLRPDGPWVEVVGVLKDLRYNGLAAPAPESVALPIVIGDTPAGSRMATFVVRSARSGTTALVAEIQRAVWSVNPNLSLGNVRTLGELYEASMARTSLALLVLILTGTAALLIGLVGIFGVYSYAASRRTREIGIRIALGAQQRQVQRMFLTHAVVLTGFGVVIGIGAAMGLTRLISSQLFGVSPLDPLTYAASSLILVAAGAIASYLPARRASAVDPRSVLAGE